MRHDLDQKAFHQPKADTETYAPHLFQYLTFAVQAFQKACSSLQGGSPDMTALRKFQRIGRDEFIPSLPSFYFRLPGIRLSMNCAGTMSFEVSPIAAVNTFRSSSLKSLSGN